MSYFGSEEHQPVTWWRGHAIFAAHLVVGVFVVSMVATALLMFGRSTAVGALMAFDAQAVLHGQVWRLVTYGLWNPPSVWFAIDMLMIVWFGREVEKFFGRRKFLTLYGIVYLTAPLLFTALAPWLPASFAGETGAFAIFIAFATLYPNVPIFFTLVAKWIALILVAIYTLIGLADRSWETLLTLWSTAGVAYLFVRYQQGHLTLPPLRPRRRKPVLRVLPDLPASPTKRPSAPAAPTPASMAEVDALLDKIAQSGIGSLTAKERAKLDDARRELKRRSGA